MTYVYDDTTPDALAKQLESVRDMSPQRRLEQAMMLSAEVRKMAFDAIRRRHPDLDERGVRLRFIELAYGPALANEVARHVGDSV